MKFFAVLLIVAALAGCAKDKPASAKSPEEAFKAKTPVAKTTAKSKTQPAAKDIPPTPQPPAKDAQADLPVITTTDDNIGRVAMVNVSARFAVVTFPFGRVPQPGQQLTLYRKGVKVGQLRVTGPQREFNTVADVIAGSAEADDEVRPE
jgi:hypothetical protein